MSIMSVLMVFGGFFGVLNIVLGVLSVVFELLDE